MDYLIHLGYVISLGAFVARDILLLRTLLVVAQVIVGTSAIHMGFAQVATWNSIFAVINSVWIVLIFRDRRELELPPDLEPIYSRRFAALSPREFQRWWAQGRRQTVHGARLATTGEKPESLYYVLNGEVRVSRGATTVTTLPAGYFVAEMSLLTGHAANADVDAIGDVELMQWPSRELRALRDRSPALWIKIQSAIGYDLVEKIRRGDERLAAH